MNLRTKGQRALWRSLSGSKLSQWPDWIEYLRHVDRRDALVHRGRVPGGRQPIRSDAKNSLETTRSFASPSQRDALDNSENMTTASSAYSTRHESRRKTRLPDCQ